MKMSQEELKTWGNEQLVELGDYIYIDDIRGVNHKPHPYMIGNSHVAWASDNHGGMLGEYAIESLERAKGPQCYWKGERGDRGERCGLPYHQHTCDTVAFMVLRRDLTNKEAHTALIALKEKFEEHNIEGFAFVDKEGEYRIAPPEEEVVL